MGPGTWGAKDAILERSKTQFSESIIHKVIKEHLPRHPLPRPPQPHYPLTVSRSQSQVHNDGSSRKPKLS
eukprot:1176296-Prorocentrum_minimum.AAC.4